MFVPATRRIRELVEHFPYAPAAVDAMLGMRRTAIYVDYANVRNWATSLSWNIDLERLYQFFKSFTCTTTLRFYYGTLQGDPASEDLIRRAEKIGFDVRTKPVKRIRSSIDMSNIPPQSLTALGRFIGRPLLKSLPVPMVRQLNDHLRALNLIGVLFFEDLKCNFDVEISTDMIIDQKNGVENTLLWSCDGDFADTLRQLRGTNQTAVAFVVTGKIARELNELQKVGLRLFDVRHLKEFLCWPRELKGTFHARP